MNVTPSTKKFGLGAPVRRKEDASLITGNGQYIDDIQPAGALHAYILRSQMANARIKVGDLSAARSAPGISLIVSAADISQFGPLPCQAVQTQIDGTRHPVPDRPILCADHVRHVGDPILFIVAENIEAAESAAENIEIDYDPLEPAIDLEGATAPDAPLVWPELKSNIAFNLGIGDSQKAAPLFEKAAHIVDIELVNNRLVSNYIEPRGCIGEYDVESGRYILSVGTQGGHGIRDIIAKSIMHIDPAQLRVITPDVGGGFGTKAFAYQEYPLCLFAAKSLGRPVKWICKRSEHFLIDAHGRDNLTKGSLAIDENGKFLALKVDLLANMGAYLSQFAPFIPFLGITMATGLYDIPTVDISLRGVYTHTVPVDAYRGAGRPEAAYMLERLVDKAARQIGIPPAELRARNFIKSSELPYKTPAGRLYDTGNFPVHLKEALKIADWEGFEKRRKASHHAGKFRGIGMCSYIEACAFAGSEEATVALNKDGSLSLFIGTQSNGQGHATAYGQIIAEQFDLPLESINVIQGDTDAVRRGGGTGGSRSIPLGLPSVLKASQSLVALIKQQASNLLEAGAEDIELAGGEVRIAGTDQAVSLAEIANKAAGEDSTLQAREVVKQDEATYPNGTHICELEIDPDTGTTEILNYVIVDDFGVTVNPLLLAGQVHGGTAQAIGQALLEHVVYDDTGQLVSGSFLDYQMPRAADIPEFNFNTRNVPSTTNALGIKGAGEAGSIGGCAAVMNALCDGLLFGANVVEDIDMPATPLRVWQAIQRAKKSTAA